MEPAITPDDVLLVTPPTTYHRGDIVAFQPPADWGAVDVPFIKRIVGLSGESVSIRDGRVFVDGQPLDEPYIYPGHEPYEATNVVGGSDAWVVSVGDVFVLGDHRAVSADSRVFGPVSLTAVTGRITWRCAPSPGPIR